MKCEFTRPVGTSQFYREDLMGDAYDPPGIDVHEDDDGTRWFRVQRDIGEALVEQCDDIRERPSDESADDSTDN